MEPENFDEEIAQKIKQEYLSAREHFKKIAQTLRRIEKLAPELTPEIMQLRQILKTAIREEKKNSQQRYQEVSDRKLLDDTARLN